MAAFSSWDETPAESRRALVAAWRDSLPTAASALHARWWQFETWLRSLVYVELRARDGMAWDAALPSATELRASRDEAQAYMATPDAQHRLAYLDVTPLFDLIERDWGLFEDALIDPLPVWLGRVPELTKIRHRIGHCRRPHGDDLGRLEQTLRDIDASAFRAASAFNRQIEPPSSLADPLVEAWVKRQHPTASRLVEHADRTYDTTFSLAYSHRPWAVPRTRNDPVTGRSGYLWHARWLMTRGGINLRRLWQDSHLDSHREAIVYICTDDPWSLSVSFAAVDDADFVADAIGNIFDGLLMSRSPRQSTEDDALDRWRAGVADLDPRVQIDTAWSLVDDSMQPITMFGA